MKRMLAWILVGLMLFSSCAFAATMGETNALKSAKSYLDYSAFSYKGLIEQLEYEGYSNSEATYAVDNCGADWKKQALKSAKSYLDYTAFSYDGLIEQLEYEEFTNDQAVYAAKNCGADWYEQAAKCAENYLEYSSFSRSGLIEQLEYEGFTHDQAVYGADLNGYGTTAKGESGYQNNTEKYNEEKSDDNITYVPSTYLKGMGLSAEDWYAFDIARNYFVLCMVMDCLDVWSDDETIISAEALNYDTIYMFVADEDVNVWQFGTDNVMMFLFDTERNEAHYAIAEVDNIHLKADEYMEALRSAGDIPSFTKLDSDDIMELIDSHT